MGKDKSNYFFVLKYFLIHFSLIQHFKEKKSKSENNLELYRIRSYNQKEKKI